MIVSLKNLRQVSVDILQSIRGSLNILDLPHMLGDEHNRILDGMNVGDLIQVKIDGFDYGIRSVNQYAYCTI